MLNSPMLSIFQHFQAIPLRSPLISLRSKWRLTWFSRRFAPKNQVRLHKPSGQLPRWGAKNDLPLNLIALPSSGRRLAHALYWQNGINEFRQSVRFLNDHGIGLWGRSPCDHCIYSMGRGRESTCDFPLPDVSCLVPYVDLSPLHITPFSLLSFSWKAPYRCHADIDMVLFIGLNTGMIKKWKDDLLKISWPYEYSIHYTIIESKNVFYAYMIDQLFFTIG